MAAAPDLRAAYIDTGTALRPVMARPAIHPIAARAPDEAVVGVAAHEQVGASSTAQHRSTPPMASAHLNSDDSIIAAAAVGSSEAATHLDLVARRVTTHDGRARSASHADILEPV